MLERKPPPRIPVNTFHHHPSKMRCLNDIFPLTGCSAILLYALIFFKVTTPMCNAECTEDVVTFGDLLSYVGVHQQGEYLFENNSVALQQLKIVLGLDEEDLQRIRQLASIDNSTNPTDEFGWKCFWRSLIWDQKTPFLFLKKLRYPTVPFQETDFKKFVDYMRNSIFRDAVDMLIQKCDAWELNTDRKRVLMFRKFAQECVQKPDSVEAFCYALGYRSIPHDDPKAERLMLRMVVKEFNFDWLVRNFYKFN